jgi:phosphoglycerate kinase
MPHIKTVGQCSVFDKRVFVRADLNVPFTPSGAIESDFRLQALLPTLEYLLDQEATVIIASHLGRPTVPDITLSTRQLLPWFLEQGYTVTFGESLEEAEQLSHSIDPGTLILLENLRFFPGEMTGTAQERDAFARQLAAMADIYVNDAFGAIHKKDTSIALLPRKFLLAHRCMGLTVEREITHLAYLTEMPEHPFVLVLGGAKLDDKLPLIKTFLSSSVSRRPDTIIIGGALAFPFLHNQADDIVALAKKNRVNLVLPIDFVYSSDQKIIDIGPDSCKIFASYIRDATTLFANGTMGVYENPESRHGTEYILNTIADTHVTTIVGGGDCVAALHQLGLQGNVSFVSTGGGATLAFLGASDPYAALPGLAALAG